MKKGKVLKKGLWGILAAGIVLSTSTTVYCTEWFDDTTIEEYIKKNNEEAAKLGYTTLDTIGDSGTTQETNKSTTGTSGQETATQIKSCTHEYVDSIIKEPTCSEPGMMESKCSKCGDTYKTEIPATGKHDYVSETTKEATCTEAGEATYTCSVCGDSYIEEIPATGHTYEAVITKEATCTESGLKTYTCAVCGDSYTEEIPATGHVETAEEVTKEAGLFTEGEKVVKCAACGEILSTEVIPSKYPISYLYVLIAVLGGAAAIVAFIILRKRNVKVKDSRTVA